MIPAPWKHLGYQSVRHCFEPAPTDPHLRDLLTVAGQVHGGEESPQQRVDRALEARADGQRMRLGKTLRWRRFLHGWDDELARSAALHGSQPEPNRRGLGGGS